MTDIVTARIPATAERNETSTLAIRETSYMTMRNEPLLFANTTESNGSSKKTEMHAYAKQHQRFSRKSKRSWALRSRWPWGQGKLATKSFLREARWQMLRYEQSVMSAYYSMQSDSCIGHVQRHAATVIVSLVYVYKCHSGGFGRGGRFGWTLKLVGKYAVLIIQLLLSLLFYSWR